jgi:hypothetical protein
MSSAQRVKTSHPIRSAALARAIMIPNEAGEATALS